MAATAQTRFPGVPTLDAATAEGLMTRNPISIRADATIREAIALLIDRGISAAPVIDIGGRPVGVVSRTDILVHDRETVRRPAAVPEYYDWAEFREIVPSGFQVEVVDDTLVRDIMTPVVFAVAPDAPAAKVITDMLAYRVHRLFVVDADGVLVGVISALDILKHLHT
jgi:CBS domain-containing protein